MTLRDQIRSEISAISALDTVLREIKEELGFAPAHALLPPLMLTVTETVGLTAGHTDVSLWYVVEASRAQPIVFDQSEFHAGRWFPLDQAPLDRSDPHLGRFISKLAKLSKPNHESLHGPQY